MISADTTFGESENPHADPEPGPQPDPRSEHRSGGPSELEPERAESASDPRSGAGSRAPAVGEAEIAAARSSAVAEAGDPALVGEYRGAVAEDEVATTLRFAALDRGYRGWSWSVTVALIPGDAPTISEVVLLPGEDALRAPTWVPWEERVRPGDLGVGDLLPAAPDDDRLVPGYVQSDDPALEDLMHELGFGRERVLSRIGRDEAADRWHSGSFGPADPMALSAPGHCVTCGFYVRMPGLLGATFGACANEFSPADGRVVDAGFGCGAHSDVPPVEPVVTQPAVVDELILEVHRRPDSAPPAIDDAEVGVDASGVDASVVEVSGVEASGVEAPGVEASGVDDADAAPTAGPDENTESAEAVTIASPGSEVTTGADATPEADTPEAGEGAVDVAVPGGAEAPDGAENAAVAPDSASGREADGTPTDGTAGAEPAGGSDG